MPLAPMWRRRWDSNPRTGSSPIKRFRVLESGCLLEHFERSTAPFRTPETLDFTGVSGVFIVGTRLLGFFPSKQIFRKSVSILLAFCERKPR